LGLKANARFFAGAGKERGTEYVTAPIRTSGLVAHRYRGCQSAKSDFLGSQHPWSSRATTIARIRVICVNGARDEMAPNR
jgi:hypothetical protein